MTRMQTSLRLHNVIVSFTLRASLFYWPELLQKAERSPPKAWGWGVLDRWRYSSFRFGSDCHRAEMRCGVSGLT